MVSFRLRVTAVAFLVAVATAAAAGAQPPVARPQPPPPVPGAKAPVTPSKPASGPTTPAAPQPGASGQAAAEPAPGDAAPAGVDVPPSPAQLNAPLFPTAQFLASYDAGQGQTFYLYGCTQSFSELVQYYRSVLKDKGELVFDAPATHVFEIGRFKETEVAFAPGVTIKDYAWNESPGYLNPKPGGVPPYFPTVIQIVTPPPALAGRRIP
jgi:hypothetical protein